MDTFYPAGYSGWVRIIQFRTRLCKEKKTKKSQSLKIMQYQQVHSMISSRHEPCSKRRAKPSIDHTEKEGKK